MTDAELVKQLAYWQRQLRLQAWEITVELVPDRLLLERWAEVHIDAEHLRAHVRITDPAGTEGRRQQRFVRVPTIVESLVHELVEMLLDDESDRGKEQAINRVVYALLGGEKDNQR